MVAKGSQNSTHSDYLLYILIAAHCELTAARCMDSLKGMLDEIETLQERRFELNLTGAKGLEPYTDGIRDEWLSLQVSYSDIKDVTDNFSESLVIGRGGFGKVYRAILGGRAVAIKILDSTSSQGQREFFQEVDILNRMHHPHLVKLVGACFDGARALVYEFLPNGSLEECLKESPEILTWQMRTRIIYEICLALSYLHSKSVIHADLKPANVLLDANFKSKLSDFGLCRFLPEDMATAPFLETSPVGTPGYTDPWFLDRCILRPGSDLYSLGITVLKLLTRMSPVGLSWKISQTDQHSLPKMIDPTAGNWPFELAKEMVYWSLQCCYHNENSSEVLTGMSTCLLGMLDEIEQLQGGRFKPDGDPELRRSRRLDGKRCELQEYELQKSAKKAQDAMAVAAEESAKFKAAKEVIKSLTAQLKDMAERLPPGVYESEDIRSVYLPNGNEANLMHHTNMNGEHQLKVDSNGPDMPLSSAAYSTHPNGTSAESYASADARDTNETVTVPQNRGVVSSHQPEDNWNTRGHKGNGDKTTSSNRVEVLDGREQAHLHNVENGSKSRSPSSTTTNNQVEAEWIEQYEPGVYITLVALRDGTRDLKRVRFSRRRFGEHQAEAWWSENRENVYEKYNVRGSDRASSVASTQSAFRSDDFSSSSRV